MQNDFNMSVRILEQYVIMTDELRLRIDFKSGAEVEKTCSVEAGLISQMGVPKGNHGVTCMVNKDEFVAMLRAVADEIEKGAPP